MICAARALKVLVTGLMLAWVMMSPGPARAMHALAACCPDAAAQGLHGTGAHADPRADRPAGAALDGTSRPDRAPPGPAHMGQPCDSHCLTGCAIRLDPVAVLPNGTLRPLDPAGLHATLPSHEGQPVSPPPKA